MKYITPLEEFHPKLQTILKEFARKSHAVNLEVVGRVEEFLGEGRKIYYKAVFIDPRFPEREDRQDCVGFVQYNTIQDMPYVVGSRLIKNEKYRKGSLDFYTKVSKNEAKVVKLLTDYAKPFSHSEIFDFSKHEVRDLLRDWRRGLYNEGSVVWNVSQSALFEEVKHLRDLGVHFKTEAFSKMAQSVEAREEHVLRNTKPLEVYHVFVEDSGRVAVTAKTFDTYSDVVNATSPAPTFYDSLESLPESLLANVSMLKILGQDKNKSLDGIGFRVSDREFFVMNPLASNTNA